MRTSCLIFGVSEALGAVIWCVAGAGIFGSPLTGMDRLNLVHVWAFLLTGPFSALLAAIVALWRPRAGGAWLVGGGVASGVFAVPFLLTDAHILPLALASAPMVLMGRRMLRSDQVARAAGETDNGRSRNATGKQGSASSIKSVLLGAVFFFVAACGALAPFLLLMDGAGESRYRFAGGALLLLVSVAGLLTVMRKRLHVRFEFLAGMWLASLLVGLNLLFG